MSPRLTRVIAQPLKRIQRITISFCRKIARTLNGLIFAPILEADTGTAQVTNGDIKRGLNTNVTIVTTAIVFIINFYFCTWLHELH